MDDSDLPSTGARPRVDTRPPTGPFGVGDTGLTPLPITAVTCLEDRAQVERAGTVSVVRGVQRLRVGPVTPLVVDRTLRAEVRTAAGDPAGRVVDVRVLRRSTPPPADGPGRDASRVRLLVHGLEERERDLRRGAERLSARLAVIAQARADVLRYIAQSAGSGECDPGRWASRIDLVSNDQARCAEQAHAVGRELDSVGRRLAEARAAMRRAESEPSELTACVEVVLDAVRDGEVVLHVAHLVPCALWRPAYRAVLGDGPSSGAGIPGDDGAVGDGERSVRLECEAVVWQCTGEDWPGVTLSFSTARPTLAARPPTLSEDELVLRDRPPQERGTVEVDLREEALGDLGVGSVPGELPGVDDGGEVRVLHAPHPVVVPGDGLPHRVALDAFDASCEVESECAPELSALVGQVVYARNSSGHVLLAGPVDLVRGSGFVGRAELPFTAAGARMRLPFGAEDVLRVERYVTQERESGLGGRTTVRRTVRLFVSHLAAPGSGEARLVLRERVPVSEVSAVQVRLGECDPQPRELSADGIACWDVLVAAGELRELVLRYEISASGRVVGL